MVWAAGKRLQNDKYIIEKILSENSYGITYQARQALLQQLIVIKTPNEKLKNHPEYPIYLERFVTEELRLEKLSEKQHPHIVCFRDFFEEDGIYCLVRDFVSGNSLFDLVWRRGALPTNEAVEYVRQIGEALITVHQTQLTHCNTHPGNIIVQSDGRAVLIDFGIAREILQTIETSKLFSNIAFAPYEQMMGSREPTVDIYSLAASLYYAVTGQCPTSSLERKLKDVQLLKPKQLANISEDLNWAILKGMELEAKNRPQSMQEWLKLLEVANLTVRVSSSSKNQQQRNIPWCKLATVLLSNSVLGFLLKPWAGDDALSVALTLALGWAVILALIWSEHKPTTLTSAKAAPEDWLLAFIYALGLTMVLIVLLPSVLIPVTTSAWAWVWAWIGTALVLASPFTCVWATISVFEDLLNFFSKCHTFLIVNGTSALGLGLGWLAYQIFLILR